MKPSKSEEYWLEKILEELLILQGNLQQDILIDGSLYFGSMFIDGVDIIVPILNANPTEVKNAGEDGWTAGELNGVTFPTGGTEHYLIVTEPGRYEIAWNTGAHIDVGGRTEIHGGVMINNVAVRNTGENHRTVTNTQDSGAFSGVCILDLPNGDEQVSLWVINDLSNNLHVEHGTVTIKLIGKT